MKNVPFRLQSYSQRRQSCWDSLLYGLTETGLWGSILLRDEAVSVRTMELWYEHQSPGYDRTFFSWRHSASAAAGRERDELHCRAVTASNAL